MLGMTHGLHRDHCPSGQATFRVIGRNNVPPISIGILPEQINVVFVAIFQPDLNQRSEVTISILGLTSLA